MRGLPDRTPGQSPKKIPVTFRGRAPFIRKQECCLHPFEGTLPVEPDVTDDQDTQKNEHARQSVDFREAEALLPSRKQHGPGKEKGCFHIEDYKKNRYYVKPN